MNSTELKTMIIEELKKNGLDIAEDLAITIVKVILALLPKIALATENTWDDLIVPLLAVIEPAIMKELDKIDGKEG